MEITSVKIQDGGYLLNGSMLVPSSLGNRHYQLINKWISEGNEPDPEYTEEELDLKEKAEAIADAKAYLEATDWIVSKISAHLICGNDTTELQEKYATELAARVAARASINENEA